MNHQVNGHRKTAHSNHTRNSLYRSEEPKEVKVVISNDSKWFPGFCCANNSKDNDLDCALHKSTLKPIKKGAFHWTFEIIKKYANPAHMLKHEYLLSYHKNKGGNEALSQYEIELKEQSRNEFIGDKYNNIYDSLMKQCKANLIHAYGEEANYTFLS